MSDEQTGGERTDENQSAKRTTYNRGVVRPVECLKEGWELIKGSYWLFFGISFVANLIAGAVPLVLVGPMMCGIYLCLFSLSRGKPLKFEMLFKGFDHFLQSLIATVIKSIPMFVVFGLWFILFMILMISQAGGAGPNPRLFGLGMGVFYLAIFVFAFATEVVFFFIYPLIVDQGLPGIEACRISFKAVTANLGGVIGLLLLIMLLGIAGFLVCCIGVYFVMPIHFAAVAVAYRKVFPDADSPRLPPPEGPEADYGPPPGTDEA
jgi:hypothetical protein